METMISKKVIFIVDKRSKEWLADRLGYTAKTIENWMNAITKPKFADKHFINRWYNQIKGSK